MLQDVPKDDDVPRPVGDREIPQVSDEDRNAVAAPRPFGGLIGNLGTENVPSALTHEEREETSSASHVEKTGGTRDMPGDGIGSPTAEEPDKRLQNRMEAIVPWAVVGLRVETRHFGEAETRLGRDQSAGRALDEPERRAHLEER